jgi:hypothetical protein
MVLIKVSFYTYTDCTLHSSHSGELKDMYVLDSFTYEGISGVILTFANITDNLWKRGENIP